MDKKERNMEWMTEGMFVFSQLYWVCIAGLIIWMLSQNLIGGIIYGSIIFIIAASIYSMVVGIMKCKSMKSVKVKAERGREYIR